MAVAPLIALTATGAPAGMAMGVDVLAVQVSPLASFA
jgi:hypothetical protein